MKRLFAQIKFCDDLNNKKTLNIYINKEVGDVTYSLFCPKTFNAYSLSNLQFGVHSDDLLPDNVLAYKSNRDLFHDVLLAIDGCVYRHDIVERLLF